MQTSTKACMHTHTRRFLGIARWLSGGGWVSLMVCWVPHNHPPTSQHTTPQTIPAATLATAALAHIQTTTTMSARRQGLLSTPGGATRRTHGNTSHTPHPPTTFTRRTLLPNPVPTTSHQPRPYLLPRPPPRPTTTAPTSPFAMFWWCWDDQCGRANPLNARFCGYCGGIRSFRRYGH